MTKESNGAFYTKLSFWIRVAGVVVAIIFGLIAMVQRNTANAARQERDQAKTMTIAAQATQEATTRKLEELQERIKQEKDSIHKFLELYSDYVWELKVAVSKYRETPNADNEPQVYLRAKALRDFVQQWREVQPFLSDLLDGNIGKLELATQQRNIAAIEATLKLIEVNFAGKAPLLEKAAENLK